MAFKRTAATEQGLLCFKAGSSRPGAAETSTTSQLETQILNDEGHGPLRTGAPDAPICTQSKGT
jgi:hypothetical protein